MPHRSAALFASAASIGVHALASRDATRYSFAQQKPQGRGGPTPPPPTLGLENGTLDFDTPDFTPADQLTALCSS